MADAPALTIRPIAETDATVWRAMWTDFVTSTGADPAAVATDATWARLVDPDSPILGWVGGLDGGPPIGFVNCVIHLNTFGDRPVCYLEDLYVAPPGRGTGLAAGLIDTVTTAARERGWSRVYWHSHEENYRARALYDRMATRSEHVRYQVQIG